MIAAVVAAGFEIVAVADEDDACDAHFAAAVEFEDSSAKLTLK